MKVAIVGSRTLEIEILKDVIPKSTTQIISGSAKGIDLKARQLAVELNIPILEICPDYARYGRIAPIKRNDNIIELSDMVIAFWNGKSKGTKYVIDRCKQLGKPLKVYTIEDEKK